MDAPSQPGGPAPLGAELGHRHRFRLERWLGGGSFGGVYEATTLHAEGPDVPAQVAVKVLGSSLPDRAVKHVLQRELSSLLAVHDARIPRVYDWSLEPPYPFIAMEYFPAGTLASLQARVGPLVEAEAVALLESLLEALAAAHAVGILHLDVKPANVLLDGSGGFVLTDFGIAQAPRAELMLAGLGSSGWQSPEQEGRRKEAIDLRTDLFGAGATVWSALTQVDLAGRQGAVLRKRAEGSALAYPPISFVRKGKINPELERIVMSLLARDPGSRPGSAGAVLAEVRALREGRVGGAALPPGRDVGADEAQKIVDALMDPLVARLFNDLRGIRALHDAEALCRQGDRSFFAFVLLRGGVRIVRDGVEIARVDREGDFLGEIAALTGDPRNATMVAIGETAVRVMDAAQLESVVAANPALAVRLLRTMANRFKYLEAQRAR